MTLMAKKHLLIVELNEFNPELLALACAGNKLTHIQKILKFHKANYKTNDRYNSGDLESWVQWTSVHTGVSAKQHNVKHPGECPVAPYKTFWEQLSHEGISTGVWGALNAKRNLTKHTDFFVPHSATLSETAYPEILNSFLTLPRLITENPFNLSELSAWDIFCQHFFSSAKMGITWKLYKIYKRLKHDLKTKGFQPYIYKIYQDLIATIGFIAQKQQHQPQVSILFLDSLAYLQRYHWQSTDSSISHELQLGLTTLDEILGLLMQNFENDSFIVHNSLSQMQNQQAFRSYYYAPINPWGLLNAFGINANITQLTPHHMLAKFSEENDCKQAISLLEQARINGRRLFNLKQSNRNLNQLYCHIAPFEELEANTTFEISGKSYHFYDYFKRINTQTSQVISLGTIFSQHIKFPNHIFNHEFNHYIYHYFMPDKYPLKAEFIEDEKKAASIGTTLSSISHKFKDLIPH